MPRRGERRGRKPGEPFVIRRRLLASLLAATLPAALAAALALPASAQPARTLTIGMGGAPTGYDPHFHSTNNNNRTP